MCSAQDVGHDVYYLLPNTLSELIVRIIWQYWKTQNKKRKKTIL